MAAPKNAPKKVLEQPPRAWQQVHDASRRRLLKAEAQSTVQMRTAVRQVHRELIATMGDTKVEALRALKVAREKMARVMSDHINATRVRARDAALEQTQHELKVLARETGRKGLAHRLGSAGEVTPTATATDLAAADAVGHSFASRWAQSVMHHVVNAPEDSEINIAIRARMAAQQMDHQLERIATTENAKAYNDQHEDAIEDALTGEEELAASIADAMPEEEVAALEESAAAGLPKPFKYWDAYLDRKTCGDCSQHNGEMVPVGQEFSGGDQPGFMHPNCRCIETIVYVEG